MNNIQIGRSDNFYFPVESFGETILRRLKEKDPNSIALIDISANKEITYGELLRLTINVAINLKKLGIKKDDVIVIVSQNNWKFAVILLSIFYIGAILNPLNHDYTEGELEHAFNISKPKMVIYTKKNSIKIENLHKKLEFIKKIFCLDEEIGNGFKNNSQLLFQDNNIDLKQYQPDLVDSKEQVALVLSSSGTTGLPKGVLLTHNSIRIGIVTCLNIGICEKDTTVAYLPLFHVFGVDLTLGSILAHAKCILIEKFIPDIFLETIQNYKVTKLFTVPPILNFLAQTPLLENYNISSVQEILCGAAPVSTNVVDMLIKRCKIDVMRQIYGLTETTGPATFTQVEMKKYGSVGRPAPSFQIKVCEVNKEIPLGPNQLGEICIKGSGIMKGYLNNPTETQNAFDSYGFLRTGDCGYYDDDGDFYIVDRLKEVIKCKGFQVAPAELENILIKHPAIKDVGVVGKADDRAGEVPVAFVVKETSIDVSENDIIDYVAQNVSVQKQLYGGVRFVDQVPKNASGKILRRVLRDMIRSEEKMK